ncbi:MAG: hypothetical protein GY750_01040 [Lentisphaerae bacterium]|nr:hypothetical protein [Lentisphaerota bacterium]MCP4100003.1 hypothetical protein [Lentisphaerota bacterium]
MKIPIQKRKRQMEGAFAPELTDIAPPECGAFFFLTIVMKLKILLPCHIVLTGVSK